MWPHGGDPWSGVVLLRHGGAERRGRADGHARDRGMGLPGGARPAHGHALRRRRARRRDARADGAPAAHRPRRRDHPGRRRVRPLLVVRRARRPRARRRARRAGARHARPAVPVAEGQVGAGVGMETFGYAGGIGTSSRVVGEHTLGVLVLSNFGLTERFVLCGRPVGRELASETASSGEGSCICLVATDAPLLPHQLRRLARRPFLGLARTGSYGSHGSGEISFAWTTANLLARDEAADVRALRMLRDDLLSLLFAACAEAAEEAVLNALCAGRDLRGYDGQVLPALPRGALRAWRDSRRAGHRYARRDAHCGDRRSGRHGQGHDGRRRDERGRRAGDPGRSRRRAARPRSPPPTPTSRCARRARAPQACSPRWPAPTRSSTPPRTASTSP